jgi:hypothetical protein
MNRLEPLLNGTKSCTTKVCVTPSGLLVTLTGAVKPEPEFHVFRSPDTSTV